MKQLKDIEYTEAIIKVSIVKEHFSNGKLHEFKDKMYCVKVTHPTFTSSTCFSFNKTGRKRLIDFIKSELYFPIIKSKRLK